jgi:hypothetical protein
VLALDLCLQVLFGVPFSSAIDSWSLGCIAVELLSGSALFGGCNDSGALVRRMTALCGAVPRLPTFVAGKFWTECVNEQRLCTPATTWCVCAARLIHLY